MSCPSGSPLVSPSANTYKGTSIPGNLLDIFFKFCLIKSYHNQTKVKHIQNFQIKSLYGQVGCSTSTLHSSSATLYLLRSTTKIFLKFYMMIGQPRGHSKRTSPQKWLFSDPPVIPCYHLSPIRLTPLHHVTRQTIINWAFFKIHIFIKNKNFFNIRKNGL